MLSKNNIIEVQLADHTMRGESETAVERGNSTAQRALSTKDILEKHISEELALYEAIHPEQAK